MSPPRRLAPRSGNQFRVGPPFGETTSHFTILDSNRIPVRPQIHARLDRGFDLVGEKWIGYKRNYFTLVASFVLSGLNNDAIHSQRFYYVDENRVSRPIQAFQISLTSFSPEDVDSRVTLVQHTAKRDRGPQNTPPKYYVVPGNLPEHDTMKQVANIRNDDKIEKYKRLFYLSSAEHERLSAEYPRSTLSNYPQDANICLVARYERIQFSCVGEGLRKSATTNNKHFILVIQLSALREDGTDVVLATSESPPLVVRGRSPSSYVDMPQKGLKLEKGENVEKGEKVEHRRIGGGRAPLGVNNNITNLRGAEKAKRKARPFHDSTNCFSQAIYTKLEKFEVDPEIQRRSEQRNCDRDNGTPTQKFTTPQQPRVKPVFSPENDSFSFTHPKDSNAFFQCLPHNNFIIPQDENYPVAPDSSSSADDEPMNINHTQFRSEESLEQALILYEADKPNLDSSDYSFLTTLSSGSIPVPVPFATLVKTSTPLQITRPRPMRPCLGRNLFPEVERCKHGFKKRCTKEVVRYSIEDALENVSDESFTVFKNTLKFYRAQIRSRPPSPHLSVVALSEFEGLIH